VDAEAAMTDEQSLIFVVLDQRPSETARETSGPARRWRREEVAVVGCSLSLSSEALLFAGRPGQEGERGAVASVMGREQGAADLGVTQTLVPRPRFLFHALHFPQPF